jgi:peptide-methionine (R)-S-oxide reductase
MTEKKFDENYWKDKLSSEQFYITRKGGTERPFSGKYLDNKENGIYICVCCETELFDSDKKYNSNSGWPSFTEPLSEHLINSLEDRSHFMVRTEVRCNNCDAHLGHVFPDGPGQNGLRYCINSLSLDFTKNNK